MVAPIPEGLENRIIPYLLIDGAAAAIDFYKNAFGATETGRMAMPDGSIAHASLVINGATVYLSDAPDDSAGDAANPTKLGGTAVLLHQYVADVDAVTAKAVQAGAALLREPADQFYGDRAAMVVDPFGHHWSLHTHVRDVSDAEMAAAMSEMTG